jgi:GNAT superfamily N-acetyltransferase
LDGSGNRGALGGGRQLVDGSDSSELPDAELTVVDLEPGDTASVLAVFEGLSPASRYQRFQSSRPIPSSVMLHHLAAVGAPNRMTHVARLDARPVGLIHWIRLPGTSDAEVACEVVDAAQHRGVGKALLRRAARSAEENGIVDFVATLFVGDPQLQRLARELGGAPDHAEAGRFRIPVALAARV